MAMVREVKLLATTSVQGDGIAQIWRRVSELWTHDGQLVVSFDPCGQNADLPEALCKSFGPEDAKIVVGAEVVRKLCEG